MSNIEGLQIELDAAVLKQRFKKVAQFTDTFAREYVITFDTSTNKRTINKNYMAETSEQLSAIFGNLENYIKLSQQQGICKILAYTRLQQEQQISAVFQYDEFSLGEFVLNQKFTNNRSLFYIQLLEGTISIIRSMSEIGIDVDQLNYGNILVSFEGDQGEKKTKVKVFYDEREKLYDKILQGIKTFSSVEKLTAMLTNNEDYFNDLMNLQDPISPQNIYQLGLLLIDLMYQGQVNAQNSASSTDDFMSRDRPVSRSSILTNLEKSYYLFEDGVISLNSGHLNQKISYLHNSCSQVIKEMTILAQAMIARQDERIILTQIPGQIDRIYKIYRDSTRKILRSASSKSGKKIDHTQNIIKTKQEGIITTQKQTILGKSNQNNTISRSATSSNNSLNLVEKNTFRQSERQQNTQNDRGAFIIQNQKSNFQASQQSFSKKLNNQLSQEQKSPAKQSSNSSDSVSRTARQMHLFQNYDNSNGKNYTATMSQEYNAGQHRNQHLGTALDGMSRGHENQVEHDINSVKNNRQPYSNPPALQNTKQTVETKTTTNYSKTVTTNEYFQNYSSHNNIQYGDSQKQKRLFLPKNPNISTQKPTHLIIPKEQILMSLKTHESIKSSLQTLIKQIQNIETLKKKDYYDNSVYYGETNSQTNKRSGLGIYVYPSGDIYYGTWHENQLINGTYVFKNGQSYEGSVKNGKQGWGKYRYSNGNVYEGQWKDDVKDGKGTMWYPNQDKYEGNWQKGKKNGVGKYFYNNGTIYQGNFVNGRKNGFGTITFTNGTRIQANWHQTHVQGEGKVFYPNGDFFQGQYQMSEKHGKGLYVWGSDNSKYEGQFKKDSLQGEARIYFTERQNYFGRIRNGKREGQGNYVYQNGDSFNGEWKNDMKLIGNYKFRNGDNFQGKFKQNQLNFGVLKYLNGQTYEGQFRNGYRHGVGSYRNRDGQVVCQGHWEADNFISSSQ